MQGIWAALTLLMVPFCSFRRLFAIVSYLCCNVRRSGQAIASSQCVELNSLVDRRLELDQITFDADRTRQRLT